MKLHIGGTEVRDGWTIYNIEDGPHVDIVGDLANMSAIADNSCEEVYASHVVEHLDFKTTLETGLGEIFRVLAPGGRLRVSVPDMRVLCELFLDPTRRTDHRDHLMHILFGGHVSPNDYHQTGFDQGILTMYLERAGFVEIERVERFGLFQDCSEHEEFGRLISLNMTARKPL